MLEDDFNAQMRQLTQMWQDELNAKIPGLEKEEQFRLIGTMLTCAALNMTQLVCAVGAAECLDHLALTTREGAEALDAASSHPPGTIRGPTTRQ